MKTIFPWLVALILAGVCVYLWNSQEEVYISGDVVYDTVMVENPINEKLELQAEIFYIRSEARQKKIDSLKLVLSQNDKEYWIEELEAMVEYIENERDSIATAYFKLGNVEAKVIYRFYDNKFEIDYKKLFDVYAREKIKNIGWGISCYALKKDDWGISLSGMIGFPKLINGVYVGVQGTSFGSFGIGITYIF